MRLEKEPAAINRAEVKAKADGTVTKHESRRLHRMQTAASKDVHAQKHDAQPSKSFLAADLKAPQRANAAGPWHFRVSRHGEWLAFPALFAASPDALRQHHPGMKRSSHSSC
ncbi:MAG: hypothetical protein Q8R33_08990 [Burkholderiales bacterium]|nr:hypothetical protein [Burkholderiales bacterium]